MSSSGFAGLGCSLLRSSRTCKGALHKEKAHLAAQGAGTLIPAKVIRIIALSPHRIIVIRGQECSSLRSSRTWFGELHKEKAHLPAECPQEFPTFQQNINYNWKFLILNVAN